MNPLGEKAALKHGFPKTLGPFALVKCKRLALWVDRAPRNGLSDTMFGH